MKKNTIILLSLLSLVAVAAVLYIKAGRKPQAINVTTARPQYGFIGRSVTATGAVEPVDTVSVGAQVSGVVTKVYVDFNSVVKKGELLAQVDASIFSAQEEASKATVANARSNLDYLRSTYERQLQLYDLGAISKADYLVALNGYNSAKATVDLASAQLRVTAKTLSYTNIYSPVNGVVLNRNISAGQTIASSFSAPVLFVIAKDLTRMQVNAAVDEADIGNVKAGQDARFTVDAFPSYEFRGYVDEVLLHPSVSANVVTYTTYINVNNSTMKLRPGMTASINIYAEEDSNALLIPARAIGFKPDSLLARQYKLIPATKAEQWENGDGQRRNAGNHPADSQSSYVWIKTGDTLTEKRIRTGIADDTNVKVLSGLSPADEVVTNATAGNTHGNRDKSQRSPFMPAAQQRPIRKT